MGAAARAMQMSGALAAVLDIAVAYANERVAFERPIAKFQAVQHNLARLAGEAAAAMAAARSAADAIATALAAPHARVPRAAPGFDDALFLEVAAAKIRVGEAAGVGAGIAHQVLGAIGFTREHVLHRFTQRLWAWRDDFDNESAWAVRLGTLIATRVAARAYGRCWHRGEEVDMSSALTFDPIRLPPECDRLREEVRAFLDEEIAAGTYDPQEPGTIDGFSRAFSRKVGAKGWIGMTWPKQYGGHERSFLERYVVTEEFRVANAPVRLALRRRPPERPGAPQVRATSASRPDVLPRICRGEVCFAIGMSEPGSGSDLFAATDAGKQDRAAAGSSTAPRCGPATPTTPTT